MKILVLDTSSVSASAAIFDDEQQLAEYSVVGMGLHSEKLMPMVDAMLASAGVAVSDVNLIGVVAGPGSFTGIRIGVSAAKGLALATGCSVVGVSSLAAMAMNFPFYEGTIRPLLDARRGEVYTAAFRWSGGSLERIADDCALSPNQMLAQSSGDTLFAGAGALRYSDIILEEFPQAEIAPSSMGIIRGASVASLVYDAYRRGGAVEPEVLLPIYIRKSEAEINLEKGVLKPDSGSAL